MTKQQDVWILRHVLGPTLLWNHAPIVMVLSAFNFIYQWVDFFVLFVPFYEREALK